MSTDMVAGSTPTFDASVLAPASGDPRTSASVRNPLGNVTNRTRWLWERLQEAIGAFLPVGGLFPIAVSISGNAFTVAGHGLNANDPVRFFSIGGSVPSPLVAATTYYARDITTNTFTVSATSGGSVITLIGGTGTIYGVRVTSGVTVNGYAGASFTIAAGPLQTVLDFLADHAALYNAQSPHFTGDMTIDGELGVTGDITGAGAVNAATMVSSGAAQFGSAVVIGATTLQNNATFQGNVTMATAKKLTAPAGSTVELLGATRTQVPIYFSDASHTIDSNTGGNRIIMLAAPAANRILTLRQSTSPAPVNGDWYEVTVLLGNSGFTVGLQREGSADYVAVLGDGVGASGNNVATARVELVSGVWRLTATGGKFSFSGADS